MSKISFLHDLNRYNKTKMKAPAVYTTILMQKEKKKLEKQQSAGDAPQKSTDKISNQQNPKKSESSLNLPNKIDK